MHHYYHIVEKEIPKNFISLIMCMNKVQLLIQFSPFAIAHLVHIGEDLVVN